MKRWTLVVALVAGGSPAFAQDGGIRQELAAEPPVELHPDLLWALDELSAVQHTWFRAHAASESGDREQLEALLREGIRILPDEARGPLQETGFTFRDMAAMHISISAASLLETALERSTAAARPIQGAHVVALFRTEFLDQPLTEEWFPVSHELARVMQEMAGVELEMDLDARLEIGPRNAGRITFACLHNGEFWRAQATHRVDPETDEAPGAKARADLIHVLIRTVEESGDPGSVAPVVLEALAFPLRWPLIQDGEPRVIPAPDVCEKGRARIGFGRRDLNYIRSLLTGIEEQRLHWDEDTVPDEDSPLVDFATTLRRRIEWELLPDGRRESPFQKSCGSLQQQMSDWRWYRDQFGVLAFWEQARGEIHGMLRGEASHPLDLEIEELEGALEALAADDPQRQELESILTRLKGRRLADHDSLTGHLLVLLAEAGPAGLVWSELDAMDREVEEARGTSQVIVSSAWLMAAMQDPAHAARRLEAHFRDRDPEPMTEMALEASLLQASHEPFGGSRQLIFDAGVRGTPAERSAAMRHSATLSPAEARTLFDTALDDVVEALAGNGPGSLTPETHEARMHLLDAAARMVLARKDEDGWSDFQRCLPRLFRKDGVNLWRDRVASPDRQRWQGELVKLLAESDYQALVQSGAIPPALRAWREGGDG